MKPPKTPGGGVPADPHYGGKPVLLIVEDDTFWRRWYIENLAGRFNLRFAGDARTAIQRVATYRPVAIICDRHIDPIIRSTEASLDGVSETERTIAGKSYVDGWQFLRQLRKSVFRDTPVILVTDDSPGGMSWLRQKLFSPDGFITKGKVTRDELLALLEHVIGERQLVAKEQPQQVPVD